jgi:hypothetical protein
MAATRNLESQTASLLGRPNHNSLVSVCQFDWNSVSRTLLVRKSDSFLEEFQVFCELDMAALQSEIVEF